MSRAPRVSVVMAAYNAEAFIEAAIESALAQTLPADVWELLVVDDGSTDGTRARAARFGEPVRWIEQAHAGLVPACNRGLREARGEFFARLDADDVVDPRWLERCLAALEKHPGWACVLPDHVQWNVDGSKTPRRTEEGNVFDFLACGTLFRTAAVRAAGGFRPLYWEEVDLYLRLQARGEFGYLHEGLYTYRRHADNMTASAARRKDGWRELAATWGAPALRAAGRSDELEAVLNAEES